MPLKARRSPKSDLKPAKRPEASAGVIPEIFVKVKDWEEHNWKRYVAARIQVRRRKYRYLVWYENGRKREFYLGAIKAIPLFEGSTSPASTWAPVPRSRARAGVQK